MSSLAEQRAVQMVFDERWRARQTQLLLGCGSRRDKLIVPIGSGAEWRNLVTVDNEPSHKPDKQFDLGWLLGPHHFADGGGYHERLAELGTCSEIHAYDVIEHLWSQGNHLAMFSFFTAMWELLAPGGAFCARIPWWQSEWALGDPSHTSIIPPATFTFLHQPAYTDQVGKSPMSDFRSVYKADFDIERLERDGEHSLVVVLRAVKPSRISSCG